MWFTIKCQDKCTDGPKHLLKQIELQRLLPPDVKKITWPIIQRNAYWAHEENVLLAMLADTDQVNRRAAIDIIKVIRRSPASSVPNVRVFLPPDLKKTVKTLIDLLPAGNKCSSEPPFTRSFLDDELEAF
jgi:hypothetical protein